MNSNTRSLEDFSQKLNTWLEDIMTSPTGYVRTPIWTRWQMWMALATSGVIHLTLDPKHPIGSKARWIEKATVLRTLPVTPEDCRMVLASYKIALEQYPSKKEGKRKPSTKKKALLAYTPLENVQQFEPRMDEYTCALSSDFVVKTNDNIRRYKGRGAVETADHARNVKLLERVRELEGALSIDRTSNTRINELEAEVAKLARDLEGSEGRRLKMAEEIAGKNQEIKSLNRQLDGIRKQLGVPAK